MTSTQTADRLMPDRFNKMHGALRALHVFLYENCQQMLDKKQRPPNNSPNSNGMWICLGSKAWSYFENFIRSPKRLLD